MPFQSHLLTSLSWCEPTFSSLRKTHSIKSSKERPNRYLKRPSARYVMGGTLALTLVVIWSTRGGVACFTSTLWGLIGVVRRLPCVRRGVGSKQRISKRGWINTLFWTTERGNSRRSDSVESTWSFRRGSSRERSFTKKLEFPLTRKSSLKNKMKRWQSLNQQQISQK